MEIHTRDFTDRDWAALRKAYSYELSIVEDMESPVFLGWTWDEVGIAQATINRLITLGVVKRTFSSNRTKAHMLTEEAKLLLSHGVEEPASEEVVEPFPLNHIEEASKTMFGDIVGYEPLKELLRECLLLDKPIHILLVGPPALAKSLFLWDIERTWGERVLWVLGSGASRAGLWDGLAERRPRVLLVDELDKMPSVDHAALLSLMERGRLVRLKVHRKLDIDLTVWVIASANRTYKMSSELLSRFKIYHVTEYTAIEFRDVVSRVLVTHEKIPPSAASEIALRLVGKTHDVRDAIRVARLSKRVGVEKAVKLLMEGG